jgi:hypothetical protein
MLRFACLLLGSVFSASKCQSCSGIRGLVCDGGLPHTSPGYWLWVNGDRLETYMCPPSLCGDQSTCVGDRDQSLDNHLCGRCIDGYVDWTSTCIECRAPNALALFLLLGGTWMWVIVLHRLSDSTNGGTMVILNYVSTSRLILGSITRAIHWLSVFENPSEAGTGVCLFPASPVGKVVFRALMPLVMIAMLWVFAGALRLYKRRYQGLSVRLHPFVREFR